MSKLFENSFTKKNENEKFVENYDKSKRTCKLSIKTVRNVLFLVSLLFLDILHASAHENYKHNYFSSYYTIIQPKVVHGRHKKSLDHTLEEDGLHATHLTLTYDVNKTNVIIDLQLNEDLIPKEHFISYQLNKNGDKNITKFTKTDVGLCHYHGTIRDNPNSQVALSTCKGIQGMIYDGDETYYIENGSGETLKSDHFLYKHSDLKHNATCGYDGGINKNHDLDLFRQSEMTKLTRFKRSTASEGTIRGPYNAKKHSSYVELVIVIDNKLYQNMNEDIKSIHLYCKNIANIINALYVPLNIFIALIGVVVWNEQNEVELSSDGDKTLKNFLHYRRKTLAKAHPNDNAQLLTKEHFDGGVVGKALKGPICTYEFSGGVSMDHSPLIGVVATTVAHEMGHNFGMEHDSPDCKCEDDRCIMSASSSSIAPRHWSSCSIDQLNLAFHHGMNYCLKNKPTKLFESPVCGNNFVEPGEQCDCGLPEFCKDNSCCNAATCMLHSNASCATGDCCDLKTCRPKKAGVQCRSAESSCDLPEYCTGESEFCPADVFKRDTETCDDGKAFCYHGICRSQSDQCKLLWGPTGKSSSDQCYDKNIDGSRHGNCGYDRLKQEYLRCNKGDTACGMLHCRHLNERLEFGMESVAVLSHSFINSKGSIIPCRTAIVDLGLQSQDPGLTPDGAKCGENKMCINQKCLSVLDLRTEGKGVDCPNDCNGNGICNSVGQCHCHKGFAPPLCKDPGVGGSIVSGPASDPNDGNSFSRILYVFFLGVCPVCGLFAIFIYYYKQNQMNWLITRKAVNIPKVSPSKQASPKLSPSGPSIGASPNSPDDMNSALLRPSNNHTENENNNMFGKFKGFTLKPLPDPGHNFTASNIAFVHPVSKESSGDVTPSRAAPSIPAKAKQAQAIPSINVNRSNTQVKAVKPLVHRSVTTKANGSVKSLDKMIAPALPPLNPGFNARPIISSPILETSTCTAKELQSPLKNSNSNNMPPVIIRPAPNVPSQQSDIAFASCEILINPVSKDKAIAKTGTLKRLASLLKKDEKLPEILQVQAPQVKATKISDKEKLKNMKISSPIPIVDETDDTDEPENTIQRTQSMRDQQTVIKRQPNLTSFGSMRQPGAKRPTSIVDRPNVPPPPRPPVPLPITGLKIPGVPGYQNQPAAKKLPTFVPRSVQPVNEYDDCEAVEAPLAHISEESSPSSPDNNIYAIIDETPHQNLVPLPNGGSGSTESMGLLGEIVNEIENRKFDSIYIASTLKKDKNKKANAESVDNDFDDYSNIKSSASTTSSGYLRPSAIQPSSTLRLVPNRTPAEGYSVPTTQAPAVLSSFKNTPNKNEVEQPVIQKAQTAYKPYHSTLNRSAGPFAAALNTKTNEAHLTKNKEIPVGKPPTTGLTRTITPPSLSTNQKTKPVTTTVPKSATTIKKPEQTSLPSKVDSKPKLLTSKPIIPQKVEPTIAKKFGVGRQSSVDKTPPASALKSTVTRPTNNSRQNSFETKLNSKTPTITSKTADSSTAAANLNSKLLNAGARPPGKISKSLQQKFENGP